MQLRLVKSSSATANAKVRIIQIQCDHFEIGLPCLPNSNLSCFYFEQQVSSWNMIFSRLCCSKGWFMRCDWQLGLNSVTWLPLSSSFAFLENGCDTWKSSNRSMSLRAEDTYLRWWYRKIKQTWFTNDFVELIYRYWNFLLHEKIKY